MDKSCSSCYFGLICKYRPDVDEILKTWFDYTDRERQNAENEIFTLVASYCRHYKRA